MKNIVITLFIVFNFDVDDSEVIILRFTQVVFGLRNRPFLLNDSVKKVIK